MFPISSFQYLETWEPPQEDWPSWLPIRKVLSEPKMLQVSGSKFPEFCHLNQAGKAQETIHDKMAADSLLSERGGCFKFQVCSFQSSAM